ncbi:MAG: hypothetical protein R3D62_02880 [Xanthobacteraceae bacterium]
MTARPFYIVAERLWRCRAEPQFPGVAGTTGYDVLNLITRVADAGMLTLDRLYTDVIGRRDHFRGYRPQVEGAGSRDHAGE